MKYQINLNRSNGTGDDACEQINFKRSENAPMLKQVMPKNALM
jgi:hypothetical protein